MALQPIESPTSTDDEYFTITTLREEEEEREKLASGLSLFGIIPTESGSGDSSSNMRPSSSKSTQNRKPTAEISLSSSDSEEDNAPPTSRTEELDGHVSDNDVQIIYENSNENLASPQSSVTDGEENQFDTWQEAVVLSDNEEETPPVPGPSNRTRKMICHRCPTEKVGTFINEEKFMIHIKRHIFGDIFQCATCQRPFSKITFCISHEIRVHGTKINYDNRDGVIRYAKRYVEETNAKRAAGKPTSSTSRRAHGNSNVKTDAETDDEDPKFYNYPIMASSALFCYRGPPVNTILEAYEIQATHGRPYSKTANAIAQKALDAHLKNVAEDRDTYKLKQCPFSKKKSASVGVKVKATKRRRTKK